MRIMQVIGNVTLNQCHPSFSGASIRLVIPLMLDERPGDPVNSPELIAAWDEWGTDRGGIAAVSEGPEASQPFRPQLKPVDAYVAALLDQVDVE